MARRRGGVRWARDSSRFGATPPYSEMLFSLVWALALRRPRRAASPSRIRCTVVPNGSPKSTR